MKKFLLFLTFFCFCIGMSFAQNVIYVDPEATDGDLIVYNGVTGFAYSTCKAAVAAASVGDTVRLLSDIVETPQNVSGITENLENCCIVVDRIVLDGQGHSLHPASSVNEIIYTKGGTIMNLVLNGYAFKGIYAWGYNPPANMNADLLIDNVTINNVIYTFHIDGDVPQNVSVIIKNSSINGWTSYSPVFSSYTVIDSEFGKSNGYAFFRPYGPVVVEGTSFSSDYTIDPCIASSILLNDCDIAGTPLTSENLGDFVDPDYTDESQWHAVVVNEGYSANAEGEITAGIYGGNLDVLNSMCADGYRGVPIPGTDPQQYLVTPIYYIHFNSSGGTGTMESVYVPREAPKNVYTVPACTFTHTVPFKNWTTQPNGGGTDVAVDAVMTLTSDTTLYAKWNCVAMIGNTPYATLLEAIDAATSGAVIKIVDNIAPEELPDIIILDKSLTITAETPNKYTLTDHRFKLSGATVEVTVSNLNFAGNSYINANNGKSLTVDHVNATVSPDRTALTWQGMFIAMGGSEYTTGLSLTVTNNVIVSTNAEGEDCACQGWAYIREATITGNTFGSAEYPYPFTAVKLMNTTDGAQVVITDNIVYGQQGTDDSEAKKFYAFDLYRNNSRANAYDVTSSNNVAYNQGTHNNNFYLYRIECNTLGYELGELMVTDNGSQIDGSPVEIGEVSYEMGETYAPVTLYGVGVVRNENNEITEGTFNTNNQMLREECAENYAAFANASEPVTYTVEPCYYVIYDANTTPVQRDTVCVKKSLHAHEVLANAFDNGTYGFESWNTDPYGGGVTYMPGVDMDLTDDVTLYAQWGYVAMIGSTGYGTLQDALDAAYDNMTGDVTIELVKDINGDFGVVRQKDGLDITINGNNHIMNGQIFITALGVSSNNTSLTIENLKFNINYDTYTLQSATDAVVYIPDCRTTSTDPFWNPNNASSWWQQHGINIDANSNLTHNITVRNCNFNLPTYGDGPILCAFKFPNSYAKTYGLILENITARGGHSLAQLTAPDKFSGSDTAVIVRNCTYTENTHNGINISGGQANTIYIIENNRISTPEGYVLRVKDGGIRTLYFSGNHFESIGENAEGLSFKSSAEANYYISSGWYEGPMTITAATNHVTLTGGTYDRPVADIQNMCAPGYMAIDAEPEPGYCTVHKMNWLTFDANGGEGEMAVQYFDPRSPQTYAVPACTFTYSGGIEFVAWNTKADGTGTSFDPANGDVITVSSDTVLYAQWNCVAMIGETPYGSLQAAVDAARSSMTGDVTIKLVKDITAWTLVRQKEDLNLTIDGQNHTVNGQILIDGDDRHTGTDILNIQNINFVYNAAGFHSSTPKAFVYFVKESGLIASSGHNHGHNVTVQYCKFDALDREANYPAYAVFAPNGIDGIYNITLDHLYATNVFTPALMNSTTNLTITNYKADEVTEGINIPGGSGSITIEYDTISAEIYALRIRDNSTRIANLDNNLFVGANSILTGNSGTLNIAGGRYDGLLGYHTGYNADNDATIYSITGGTFNEDVMVKCAEGYATFANGTEPETWTVYPAYKVKYVANNGTDACDSIYVRQSEGTVVVKECEYTNDGFGFAKWNLQADGSGSNVAPGVAYPLTADVTFYAQWSAYIAYNVEQDKNYISLFTALEEVQTDETVRLLDNLNLNRSIELAKTFTLDLNTKTITSTVQYAVNATDGEATVKNGAISSNQTYTVYCSGSANLNITDCDITGMQYTIVNAGTGTVNITGGNIVNNYSSSAHYTIQNKSTGVINVDGVTVENGKNYVVDNTNGIIRLKNHCTISGGDYVICNNNAQSNLYIEDCIITGTTSYAYVIYNSSSSGKLSVKNSEVNAPEGYCFYIGGSSSEPVVDINNCTLNAERRGVHNATIGRVNIYGNTTITLSSTNQAQCGVAQSANGTLNIGGYMDESDDLVADGNVIITITPPISGSNYGVNCSAGTLNLMGNTQINATGEYVTAGVSIGGTGTVNISGGTITADNICILPAVGSMLNISGNAVFNAPDCGIKYGYTSGSNVINISGGTFNVTGENAYAISSVNAANKAKITISGGTFNLTGANATALSLNGADTVNITGGTFSSTGANTTLYKGLDGDVLLNVNGVNAAAATIFNIAASNKFQIAGGTFVGSAPIQNNGTLQLNGGKYTLSTTATEPAYVMAGTGAVTLNGGNITVNAPNASSIGMDNSSDMNFTVNGGWYGSNLTRLTRGAPRWLNGEGTYEYYNDMHLVPVDADAVEAQGLTGDYYQLGYSITYHKNTTPDVVVEQSIPLDGEAMIYTADDVPTFANLGHTLLGWTTDPSSSTIEYTLGATAPAGTTDLVLYAVWSLTPCPDAVDADGIIYESARLGSLFICWTTSNLRSRHYSDGTNREILDVHESPLGDSYGYLYDWYSVMDTITNTVTDIEAAIAANTPLQGICPAGWHIPTPAEYEDLTTSYDATQLMAPGWVPDNGTNETGMSLVPAGYYNSDLDRVERTLVSGYFWILTPPSEVYHACEFGAACSTTEKIPGSLKMGYSVRCVANE